jgi:hypothetical protein
MRINVTLPPPKNKPSLQLHPGPADKPQSPETNAMKSQGCMAWGMAYAALATVTEPGYFILLVDRRCAERGSACFFMLVGQRAAVRDLALFFCISLHRVGSSYAFPYNLHSLRLPQLT